MPDLHHPHFKLTEEFKSKSDSFLTIALISVAVFAVLVALFAHPLVKAAVLAWMILP